jgi:hypothetical protein
MHPDVTTDSLLKTMEMLLGLAPLTQYDAIANPIGDFDNHPSNSAPYAAIEPGRAVMCEQTPALSAFKRGDPMRNGRWNPRKWRLPQLSPRLNVDTISLYRSRLPSSARAWPPSSCCTPG